MEHRNRLQIDAKREAYIAPCLGQVRAAVADFRTGNGQRERMDAMDYREND